MSLDLESGLSVSPPGMAAVAHVIPEPMSPGRRVVIVGGQEVAVRFYCNPPQPLRYCTVPSSQLATTHGKTPRGEGGSDY